MDYCSQFCVISLRLKCIKKGRKKKSVEDYVNKFVHNTKSTQCNYIVSHIHSFWLLPTVLFRFSLPFFTAFSEILFWTFFPPRIYFSAFFLAPHNGIFRILTRATLNALKSFFLLVPHYSWRWNSLHQNFIKVLPHSVENKIIIQTAPRHL